MFLLNLFHLIFHVLGFKKTSTGSISNLPKYIEIVRTILVWSLNHAKFSVGPISAIPGPILLNVASTDEKEESNVGVSKETITSSIPNIIKYNAK